MNQYQKTVCKQPSEAQQVNFILNTLSLGSVLVYLNLHMHN